jgi:peptide/nickel transport system permease protein
MSAPMTAAEPTALQAAMGPISDRVARSQRRKRWLNSSFIAGAAILFVIFFFAMVYPFISDWDPNNPDFSQPTFASPSWDHPLGTDNFGRDTLTRLAMGGRIDLLIALAGTSVTLVVGGLIGITSGFRGGWLDTLVMRFVDFTVTIPDLILLIAMVAILGTGTMQIVYAIWLVGWIAYARIVRAETLFQRKLEYVEAARVMGMSNLRIMLRHILPNVTSAAIVFAMADMVLNILTASSLSFLGLGVQPPNAEWGLMVAEARDFFLRDWRLMTYPGIAVLITGAGFGLIGDGLAQALRPKR